MCVETIIVVFVYQELPIYFTPSTFIIIYYLEFFCKADLSPLHVFLYSIIYISMDSYIYFILKVII